jgi:hypothetical protein
MRRAAKRNGYTPLCSLTLHFSALTHRVIPNGTAETANTGIDFAAIGLWRPMKKDTSSSSNRRVIMVDLPCPECRALRTSVTLRLATTAFLVCPACEHMWSVAVAGTPQLENLRLDQPRRWSGETT